MIYFTKHDGTPYRHRLRAELESGVDSRLRAMLIAEADFMEREIHSPLIITCLNRTQEENENVGGAKYSAHLDARACDQRVTHLQVIECELVKSYLECTWNVPGQKPLLYVKVHNSGHGMHLHMNIRWPFARKKS